MKEVSVQPKPIPSSGEQLAQRIHEKCSNHLQNLKHSRLTFPITTNSHQKILLCPMCKLASTYWTRFFRLLDHYGNHTVLTPYDIPQKDAPPTRERLTITAGKTSPLYRDYYKFMFVRDPYSRILSAYIDKIFAPNPTFWDMISKKEIQRFRPKHKHRSPCSSDLTFEEYIQAITTNHRRPQEMGKVDCHDESFTGACHPCEVRYDFIGKMEYFSQDSFHLYRKLQMSDSISALTKQGKQLADEDAMMDTINSPFLWKADIKKCIPWREALNRIWRKLQIRGVIGKQQLPLSDSEAEKITKKEFIDLILRTQKLTPYKDRKRQRTEALQEIYSTVKIQFLQQLKQSYKTDFDFFEYNDDPEDIFHINRSSIQYYGYLDLK